MFSEKFESYFSSVCVKSFENALPKSVGQWQVTVCHKGNFNELTNAILITISSHRFRTLAALHYSKELAELEMVSAEALDANGELSEEVQDYLGEMMNTLVGALKRDLQVQVLSLGMSTPNDLDSSCLHYVEALKVDHELLATAKFNGKAYFSVSFHTSVYGELDLRVTQTYEESNEGGLEFF